MRRLFVFGLASAACLGPWGCVPHLGHRLGGEVGHGSATAGSVAAQPFDTSAKAIQLEGLARFLELSAAAPCVLGALPPLGREGAQNQRLEQARHELADAPSRLHPAGPREQAARERLSEAVRAAVERQRAAALFSLALVQRQRARSDDVRRTGPFEESLARRGRDAVLAFDLEQLHRDIDTAGPSCCLDVPGLLGEVESLAASSLGDAPDEAIERFAELSRFVYSELRACSTAQEATAR